MSTIEKSLETIRRVHRSLGDKGLARISGVPYTTVREASRRDFSGKPIETLIKLVDAAEEAERTSPPSQDAA